jgi:signal peptidase II
MLSPFKKGLPFTRTAVISLADQAVKSFIAVNWPVSHSGDRIFIADIFNNNFLQIWHVRNKAIAFSLGHNLPDIFRPFLFILLPLLVLGFMVWYYFNSNELTILQRWAIAGITGGGAGNILDRIFRPDGVVDFISISIQFLGIKDFDRWPTFNIADTSVVICCIILLISIFISNKGTSKKPTEVFEDPY